MAFLSPFWLLAILPWAVLTGWLMRGRRRRIKVPFLDLWRGPVPLEMPKRGWRVPPAWVLLIIGALLLAVLGAARPVVRSARWAGKYSITVIVDRGITMSANQAGMPRFAAVARRAGGDIGARVSPLTEIQIVAVPGETLLSNARDWAGVIDRLPPTALDTSATLLATVRERLASTAGQVVVITDQPIGLPDDRLVRIGPTQLPQDVAIVHIAGSQSPAAQVMVRLRNDSSLSNVKIIVSSGSQRAEQTVELPMRGQDRDYFFDFVRLDSTVQAQLFAGDDQPANDRAWLVREGSNPRIEIRSAVSPEVRRMVDVYSKARPPSDGSAVMAIVGSATELATEQPGVIIASAIAPTTVRGPAIVADHPINAHVNWRSLPADVQVAKEAPAGWEPIITVDGKTLVAVKNEPIRRVWVGFAPQAWAGTTDFVVFWANVLSWVGGSGHEQYVAHPLADFQSDWSLTNLPSILPKPPAGEWPGIYQGPDGAQHALNAPAGRYSVVPESDGLTKLLDRQSPASQGVQIAPFLLLLAMACIVAATLVWRDSSGSVRSPLFPTKA